MELFQNLTEDNMKIIYTGVALLTIGLTTAVFLKVTSKKAGAKLTAKQVIDSCGEGKYLEGKVAIVTGGNSGIGLETCKALSSAGAKVILCSRSVSAAQKAIETEVAQAGEGGYIGDVSKIEVKQLDLASLKSVKAFAEEFLASGNQLDLLVLNAGLMALPKLENTDAGFEMQIGVNHFGHAYLTQLLQPKLLNQASKSRIVVLASVAHKFGKIDTSDLHYRKGRAYNPWGAYGQSKLANILFAKSLADKLPASKVNAVSVHPGVIKTNLYKPAGMKGGLLGWFTDFFTDKTVPMGAATTVWACVSPRIEDEDMRGAYLEDCGPAQPNKNGRDDKGVVREALWQETVKQLAEATASL